MIDIWKEMMKVVISKEDSLEKCLQTYIDPIKDDQEFVDMEDALVELWYEVKGFTKDDFATVDARGLGDRWYCKEYQEYKDKEYAFAGYDIPPYLLGGTVVNRLENGKVNLEGFGSEVFTPIIILPYWKGIDARERLNKALYLYRYQIDAAKEKMKAVVQEITDGKRWK